MGYKLGSNSGRAIFIKDDKYYRLSIIDMYMKQKEDSDNVVKEYNNYNINEINLMNINVNKIKKSSNNILCFFYLTFISYSLHSYYIQYTFLYFLFNYIIFK